MYANALSQAKICLITSSKFRYALQKYAEFALSGCALVGNIPHERQDFFRSFITEINMGDSDERIYKTVANLLADEPRRKKLAALGQRLIKEQFTWDTWVDNIVLKGYNAFRKGHYGIHYPYPFHVGCVAKDNWDREGNMFC